MLRLSSSSSLSYHTSSSHHHHYRTIHHLHHYYHYYNHHHYRTIHRHHHYHHHNHHHYHHHNHHHYHHYHQNILSTPTGEQLVQVQDNLFRLLAACLGSAHFQVAERALYYWNSEHLCVNVLSQSKAPVFLPFVFGPLSKAANGHWNQAVEGLAQSILKM